jgi:twitching motility protein PilJ
MTENQNTTIASQKKSWFARTFGKKVGISPLQKLKQMTSIRKSQVVEPMSVHAEEMPHETVVASTFTSGNTKTTSTTTWRPTMNVKFKPLPVIGGWTLRAQYMLTGGLVLIGLMSAIGSYLYIQEKQDAAIEKRLLARGVRATSEALAKNLQRVVNGKTDGFKAIEDGKANIQKVMDKLTALTQGEALGNLTTVKKEWSDLDGNAKQVVLGKQAFEQFSRQQKEVAKINEEFDDAMMKLVDTAMKKEADEKTKRYILSGLGQAKAVEQSVLRIDMLDERSPDVPFLINKNLIGLKKYFDDLENGNGDLGVTRLKDVESKERLVKAKNTFVTTFEPAASAMSILGGQIQGLKTSANTVTTKSDDFAKKLGKLVDAYEAERLSYERWWPLSLIGLLLAMGGIGLVIAVYVKEERRLEIDSRAAVVKNNQAVMQLLNEIEPVRSGDLTQRLTIADEITAPIANAVNDTIEDLGGLVKNVQGSSSQMASAVKDMTQFSRSAAVLSERQMSEVSNAAQGVTRVEEELQGLANKAQDTAALAEQSARVTEEGSRAVHQTLSKMRAIQSKGEDALGRVGRLQDASAQIANVLDALRDITEKTTVLSINAKLEAQRAGDAGRGFTVVAESIQTLAQQASDAMKKTGALINSVQSDIGSAARSMSEIATDVVEATRQSEVTGEVFIHIEENSNTLNDAILEMKDSVLGQAKEAIRIQQQMGQVVETVKESSKMTDTANKAALKVEATANALSRSADRFKVK